MTTKRRFQVDDRLTLITPHAPDISAEVIFRGYHNVWEAVVYNPKTGWQGRVDIDWLHFQDEMKGKQS
jgi:hypothetical protein